MHSNAMIKYYLLEVHIIERGKSSCQNLYILWHLGDIIVAADGSIMGLIMQFLFKRLEYNTYIHKNTQLEKKKKNFERILSKGFLRGGNKLVNYFINNKPKKERLCKGKAMN